MPWVPFHASLSYAPHPTHWYILLALPSKSIWNFLPPAQSCSALSLHHCFLLHCNSLSHIFLYILFLTQHSGRSFKNRSHIVSFLSWKHCRGSQFPSEKKPKLLFFPLCFSNHVLYSLSTVPALATLLSLEHTNYIPTVGPLHWPFPLPKTLSSKYSCDQISFLLQDII